MNVHSIIATLWYDEAMKLVVGLGNPGEEYASTRHNVGFRLIDSLAKSGWMRSKNGLLLYSWLGEDLELIKPQTFMNRSGEAVSYAISKHGVDKSSVFVVYDDLDIKFGEYKINFGKCPKVHNGINSIINTLQTDQFWSVRIGIENRQGDTKIPGKTYVLQNFSRDEEIRLDEIVKQVARDMREKFFT